MTVAPFDPVTFESDSAITNITINDNTAFTIGSTGTYVLSFTVNVGAITTGGDTAFGINLNGVPSIGYAISASLPTTGGPISTTIILPLTAGTIIQLVNLSGADRTLIAASGSDGGSRRLANLSIFRIF
ncbi:hypothetical protein NHG49_30750 [Bacillus sp. IBL03825]|nr:hypothetical protein [Bacillus sp. IBL03825]